MLVAAKAHEMLFHQKSPKQLSLPEQSTIECACNLRRYIEFNIESLMFNGFLPYELLE